LRVGAQQGAPTKTSKSQNKGYAKSSTKTSESQILGIAQLLERLNFPNEIKTKALQ